MRKPAALGIDVGGTKTLCVLVNKRARKLKIIKFKTAPQNGSKEFTKTLLEISGYLAKWAGENGYKLVCAGVGFAGSVDKKGTIMTSPNLRCLEGFPLGKALAKELHAPVTIGNDVQLGVLGEHKLGAAKGCSNVLGVFFGTGVGGAVVINNKLYRGASGLGGQVGGILAQPVGGPKAALSHGILDRIASKSAIATEALVMAIKDWAPYLHKKVGTDLSKVGWGAIRRAIDHGDGMIEEMLRARMHVVGIALSSIVNFLNPEMVVLGGGLMDEIPKLVMQETETGIREYLSPEVSSALKVRASRLGSYAVSLGAACVALEAWEKNR
jgi:glucokinase